MRYQVKNFQQTVIFETDQPAALATHLGVTEGYVRSRLSATKGSFTTGRGATTVHVVDHKYAGGPLAKGRPAGDYIFLKYYPDADLGLNAPREGEHEVTLDEIYVEAKRFYQKLATTTLDAKLASPTGLTATLHDGTCRSYRSEPVHYVRVPKDKWLQHLEAEPEVRARLAANRQRFDDRLKAPRKMHRGKK